MGSEWQAFTVGDLGKVVTGKTPSTSVEGNFGIDIPFVSPRDMDGSRYIYKTERCLSEQGASTVKNSVIPENSVIVSCIGSDMGKTAITTSKCVTNQQINSIIVRKEFEARFVYYNLSARKDEIRGLASGSAQPILNKKDFSQLRILLPSLRTQKSIAHILGSLDDKIELNRQINTTLETMAQALFKSWFVDFDPVIDNALAAGNPIPPELAARAERRQQHHTRANTSADAQTTPYQPLPANIQQQFPDRFVFTEAMGWVPEGWECKSLYSLADYVNGAAYKQFNPNSEQRGLPIVKIAELKAGITASTGFSDIEMPEKYAIQNEDILFSWSGNPDTSIGTFVWTHGDAWLNQHIFRVTPSESINRFFLLALLRHLNPVFAEIARDKQTTGLGHVTVKDLKGYLVVVPDTSVMELAASKLEPIFKKSFQTILNCQHVANLRDSLLPKLLSGQLRIPDAEAAVDKALAEA